MASVDLALLPVPARAHPDLDFHALECELTARVHGEVRFDAGTRGAYVTDASNYRQVPIGVVIPLSVEAGAEAVAVCREHGAPHHANMGFEADVELMRRARIDAEVRDSDCCGLVGNFGFEATARHLAEVLRGVS
ncbi:MAG: hypothetical protein ACRDTE_20715 [Pseudonocardiaceae bacterium]